MGGAAQLNSGPPGDACYGAAAFIVGAKLAGQPTQTAKGTLGLPNSYGSAARCRPVGLIVDWQTGETTFRGTG